MKSVLRLHDIRLMMNVGHLQEERDVKQAMRIDIEIDFHNPLAACHTDVLEDAVCYDSLIGKVRHYCEQHSFKLLEYASQCLYALIKADFSKKDKVFVRVTKLHPPIDILKGGAECGYGDE